MAGRTPGVPLTEKGIDPATEKIHLRIARPFGERNLCQADFGPDGFLYVAVGDGGRANDPDNNGQNLSTLYGAILRIDIRKAEKAESSPSKRASVCVCLCMCLYLVCVCLRKHRQTYTVKFHDRKSGEHELHA